MRVSGTVTRIEPWCQGVAPPDGVGTRVVPHTRGLSLRTGEENHEGPLLPQITPDDHGRFSTRLPPNASYCAILREKLPPERIVTAHLVQRYEGVELDTACLERDWRRRDAVIEVGHVEGLEIQLRSRCFWEIPCAVNPPAPPPSAAPGG